MALFLLIPALWMAIDPRSLMRLFDALQEVADRAFPNRVRLAPRGARLPDDRRTRVGIRLFGMLLAVVATAHLYREVLYLLTHWG